MRGPGLNESANVLSHFTKGLLETLPILRRMSLRSGILGLKKVWEETFGRESLSVPLKP